MNLYLMIDATTSMVDHEVDGVTRWELVTVGISDFVSSSELTGRAVNVGIQFFAWLSDSSCDVSNYSTPLVDIGAIADVRDPITSALAAYEPTGLTSSYPALSGAISYAKSWAAATSNDYTAVVFVTDGYPTSCEPQDIPSLVALATLSYAEAPSVPVHLVGIDGIYNLDVVADAGGTNQVVLIENEADPAPLTDALVSIATSPFGD